ncbi:MAG: hypothetical protein LBJ00_16795 [Planctomycetaceae bacterium]|jgi:DNA-directed RNA polymerase subunit RPC12/RpoP|nr:hypothetical protein [Planctomycetaceae bacterium]
MKTDKQSGGFFGLGKKSLYKNAGVFPLDDFEQLESGGGISVSSELLDDSSPCPYCGNKIWGVCTCGKTHCAPEIKQGTVTLTCPWCSRTAIYGLNNGIKIGGGSG